VCVCVCACSGVVFALVTSLGRLPTAFSLVSLPRSLSVAGCSSLLSLPPLFLLWPGSGSRWLSPAVLVAGLALCSVFVVWLVGGGGGLVPGPLCMFMSKNYLSLFCSSRYRISIFELLAKLSLCLTSRWIIKRRASHTTGCRNEREFLVAGFPVDKSDRHLGVFVCLLKNAFCVLQTLVDFRINPF
jgi:hypothetical protein